MILFKKFDMVQMFDPDAESDSEFSVQSDPDPELPVKSNPDPK